MRSPRPREARRPLLLAAGALVAVLVGCSAPSLVQVHGFAVHTEEMAQAFDRTYQETVRLLDEAPVTPEVAEVHERLLEEEEILEHSFGPIRQSLDAATQYARSLESLVHDRQMPASQAAEQIEGSVRGMLGPFGALAPPLPGTTAVREVGQAVQEIKDIRRIRKANRTLTRAMRKLRPAIRHYVAEVKAGIQDLDEWTDRVVDLLQQQNQILHADALTISGSYQAREDEALHALAQIATLDLTEVGKLDPHPLVVQRPTGKARQKARRDPMAPLRVAELRLDLEELHRTKAEAAAVAGLDASLGRLEGALRARKVLLSVLARKEVPVPEKAETDAVLSARVDALLRDLEERVPKPGALDGADDLVGKRLAPDLDAVGAAVLHLVQELLLVVADHAEDARARGRCGEVALLLELARVGGGLDAALADADGAEKLLGTQLTRTLSGLFDAEAAAVIQDLLGEAAWLSLLSKVRPGTSVSGPLPPALSSACRQGVGGTLTPATAGAHLRTLWLTRGGTAEIGVRAQELTNVLEVMEQQAYPAGHYDPAHAAPRLAAVDAAVTRLWEASAAAKALSAIDEVVSQRPLPSAQLLEQREDFWRRRIEELRDKSELLKEELAAFATRRADLEADRKRLKLLLQKGEAAIHAWEATHLGLDAAVRAGSGGDPLALLATAVAEHHGVLGNHHGGAQGPSTAEH